MLNRPILLAAMATLTLLGGCKPAEAPVSWIRDAKLGGPFSLINQDGQRVSDQDLKGKYRLVYFGYTRCPDACPTDLQHLMAGFRQFERDAPSAAAKVQPIFITVDPTHDSLADLKSFVRAFHPRLMGLTGTPTEISAVAKEYAAVYQVEKPDPHGFVRVDHSRTTVLYGPTGAPLILMSADPYATPERIAYELEAGVQ